MGRLIPFHVPVTFKRVQRLVFGKAKVLEFSCKRTSAISGFWVTVEKFLPELRPSDPPSPRSTSI